MILSSLSFSCVSTDVILVLAITISFSRYPIWTDSGVTGGEAFVFLVVCCFGWLLITGGGGGVRVGGGGSWVRVDGGNVARGSEAEKLKGDDGS